MGTSSGLPNADAAYVPRGKVSGYLLSLAHPLGHPKARFFRGLGFDDENAAMLEAELERLAREGELVRMIPGLFGTRYILEGRIRTPGGGLVSLTTVWLVESGKMRPRLVTAYPRKQRLESDDP